MKLTRIELRNYRCFAETTLIVDPHTTVLIGPNDVGKSYILRALQLFGARENFSNDDVRKVSAEERRSGQMELTFEFSTFTDDEIAHLQRFDVALNAKDRLSLTRTLRNPDKPAVLLNSAILREAMSGKLAPTPEPPASQEDANGNGVPPTEQPTDVAAPGTPSSEALVEHVPISDAEWATFLSDGLFPILPTIELLPIPKLLPFEVDITQLAAADPKMETAQKLLQLGGIEDLSSLTQDTPERDELLEYVSNEITKALREYWTQDPEIQIKARPSGNKLWFNIVVRGYPAYTRPQWHSSAFREYLALMATLLLRIRADEQPPVLLLDEPGVRLHPRAQRDLGQLFQKLSQRTQLIFTAHYPYLIDRNFPGQLRLLEPKLHGTEINNKPYHGEAYSMAWEPIRTALGLTVGDSLLFDDYNIIVEGVVDQLLLCAISQELSRVEDQRALDLNYTAVLPAGGASGAATLADRAFTNKLSVVALFDGEKDLKREIDSFKSRFPRVPKPLWLRDFYNVTYDFCIEDMLPKVLYLEAVNNVYGTRFKAYQPIDIDTLKRRRQSVVKILGELLPQAIEGISEPTTESEAEPPNKSGAGQKRAKAKQELQKSPKRAPELAKVEVAKEVIRLLRERGIQKPKGKLQDEYERFATLFAAMKQRLKA